MVFPSPALEGAEALLDECKEFVFPKAGPGGDLLAKANARLAKKEKRHRKKTLTKIVERSSGALIPTKSTESNESNKDVLLKSAVAAAHANGGMDSPENLRNQHSFDKTANQIMDSLTGENDVNSQTRSTSSHSDSSRSEKSSPAASSGAGSTSENGKNMGSRKRGSSFSFNGLRRSASIYNRPEWAFVYLSSGGQNDEDLPIFHKAALDMEGDKDHASGKSLGDEPLQPFPPDGPSYDAILSGSLAMTATITTTFICLMASPETWGFTGFTQANESMRYAFPICCCVFLFAYPGYAILYYFTVREEAFAKTGLLSNPKDLDRLKAERSEQKRDKLHPFWDGDEEKLSRLVVAQSNYQQYEGIAQLFCGRLHKKSASKSGELVFNSMPSRMFNPVDSIDITTSQVGDVNNKKKTGCTQYMFGASFMEDNDPYGVNMKHRQLSWKGSRSKTSLNSEGTGSKTLLKPQPTYGNRLLTQNSSGILNKPGSSSGSQLFHKGASRGMTFGMSQGMKLQHSGSQLQKSGSRLHKDMHTAVSAHYSSPSSDGEEEAGFSLLDSV